MKVRLLGWTPDPEQTVAAAARLCYSSRSVDELREEMSPAEAHRLIRMLIDRGHTSPLEHAVFHFGVEGISRVTSHQLVRHRIASYSQQSQRYVTFKRPLDYVIPPVVTARGYEEQFKGFMNECWRMYVSLLRAGIPAEDARYVLPGAVCTRLVLSMNARELLDVFFPLRTCLRAQWEIRLMANLMLKQCRGVAPVLFEKAGPSCRRWGSCPEENRQCVLWRRTHGDGKR